MRRYGSRRYSRRPRRSRGRGVRQFEDHTDALRRTARRFTYSRRAIVNIASRKKEDNMVACAIDPGGVPGPVGLPFVL